MESDQQSPICKNWCLTTLNRERNSAQVDCGMLNGCTLCAANCPSKTDVNWKAPVNPLWINDASGRRWYPHPMLEAQPPPVGFAMTARPLLQLAPVTTSSTGARTGSSSSLSVISAGGARTAPSTGISMTRPGPSGPITDLYAPPPAPVPGIAPDALPPPVPPIDHIAPWKEHKGLLIAGAGLAIAAAIAGVIVVVRKK